ncbi:peptide ABC transporter substrate-binding protein [Catenibacterium mitsuokai]|uniref:Peptide ABC transporter substrate-binding protein n=1 Tax=Catenibacterium mitsuokai TaxID=100886 RepID=A0AAW4MQU9_9FIRM|nr:peptide ABC transporter substrate-binding protein [Catenibacterium mitsuokai]MBV3366406.1 peptide ABC transporter substrate-binding protein [Catenibacterium mitsuokai]MBV3370542.1 peptide ABC transporter substrate-binding protein [Catenibacterium mitsuokai]MBV3375802.1 peptide ABC transporter substrate-binding protein [Catenibacterium mitsuokai]MBV3378038.1 peptide ABC transporter substrate-binding protein [Catenibacterium mitsuokai]MBV3379842.1 peptide ABC transporter substrate-binding pro
MKTGKTVKVLLALTTAAGMLAGCGSKTDTDTFRFANDTDIVGMDSTVVDDAMSFNAITAITDGLTTVDVKGNTIPGIAKSWDVSNNGLTYTFHLRDAKWANGDDVTAQDFVYSWHRIIKNAGNYAYMLGSEGASIKNADSLINLGTTATDEQLNTLGIKATDDKTVVVDLEKNVPYFVGLMSFPCYYPQNQKFVEKCGKNYATKPEYILGNGAYKMTKWIKGNKATFTKNDKYYDAKSVKTKNLEMYLVQDPKTAAQNFDNGKVDYATINSTLVDKYKGKDTFKAIREGYLAYLICNFKADTTANKNLRHALSYAINRKDLCDNILKDGSQPATGFVPAQLCKSPSGKDFREESGKYVDYDVKKAQEYLDAAKKELGTDTITVDLLYGTDESPMDTFAEYLQGSFTKLKGLKVNMVATVKKDRIYNREASGNFQIACTRWAPDYADPTTFLNVLTSTNSNNYGKWENAQYNSLLKQAQNETDVNKRWNELLEAEKVMMDDMPNIPVVQTGTAALQAKNVKGLVHNTVSTPYVFKYVTLK